MNSTYPTQAEKDCPTSDALIRTREGYSTDDERSGILGHVEHCDACKADLESLRFLEAELLTADQDRAEMTVFRPTAEHARNCAALDETRLQQILRAATPPTEEKIRAHLDGCAYCRRRLLSLANPRHPTGRLLLKDQIVATMLESALARAGSAVQGALAWSRAQAGMWVLVERLRVWVDQTHRICAEGLQALQQSGRPLIAKAMGDLDAEQGCLGWWIPLDESGSIFLGLQISQAKGKTAWELSLLLELVDDIPNPQGARIEVKRRGKGLFLAGPLEDYLDTALLLEPDEWDICLTLADQIHLIPLNLVSPNQS